MELRNYWILLRKWLWLLLLISVGATASAYLISNRQTPIYVASTRLQVLQGSSNSPTVTYADVLMSERLSQTYAQLLVARPVLEATIQQLELPLDVAQLGGMVSVQPVRDTQLIDLRVEHPTPQTAADIANTIPKLFDAQDKARQSTRYQESKQALEKQLGQIDKEIQQTETALAQLDEQNGEGASLQRTLLDNRAAQQREIYATVLSQLENIRLAETNARNTLSVTESAIAPRAPVRPRVLFNTLLAAVVGFLIAAGIIFLIEYMDDRVKSPQDVARVTGLSTLGVIARRRNGGREQELVTMVDPRSPIAEAYRTIRTSLQFSSVDKPIRIMVITSPGPGAGKSTTAANLGVVMAQAGKRVVLIDADLRKPNQHKRWKLPNTVGLTGALLFSQDDEPIEYLLNDSGIEGLKIMTSGQLPPNPSELLGSQKLRHLLQHLLQEHDLLIIDSPPALAVTDPVVLAKAADGVVLVVDAGETREPELAQTYRELEKVNAHVLGVVLNKYTTGNSGGYYYYYDRYYREDGEGSTKSARRRHSTSRTHPAEAPSDGIGQSL